MVPIMADLDPAPSHLLQFVRCKCKAENRRRSTSICSCRKHGLKCVSSCGTCRGKSCENNDVRDLNFISHFYKGLKRSECAISLYGQLPPNLSSKPNPNPNLNPNPYQEPVYSGAIVWTPSVLRNKGKLFISHLQYIMLYLLCYYYSVLLLSHE